MSLFPDRPFTRPTEVTEITRSMTDEFFNRYQPYWEQFQRTRNLSGLAYGIYRDFVLDTSVNGQPSNVRMLGHLHTLYPELQDGN